VPHGRPRALGDGPGPSPRPPPPPRVAHRRGAYAPPMCVVFVGIFFWADGLRLSAPDGYWVGFFARYRLIRRMRHVSVGPLLSPGIRGKEPPKPTGKRTLSVPVRRVLNVSTPNSKDELIGPCAFADRIPGQAPREARPRPPRPGPILPQATSWTGRGGGSWTPAPLHRRTFTSYTGTMGRGRGMGSSMACV